MPIDLENIDENGECPLCMEPYDYDDAHFFPCICGYQICRFCWHRIRMDEDARCPACRQDYAEDPAVFKPLTDEELYRIKKERRQKDLQRKQKAAENRKHLANVRVVQRNLVFVVGLSQRLADQEVLRRADYFGKYGKIHKVVINQSTSYAGAQGPSASAYVTYYKTENALRAIAAVNNIHVDGRTLKASLGTTKYCSHFLRGSQCPKPDCMYLHELGEEAASFTKEEMQQGKHQEYEQRLQEQFMNNQNLQKNAQNTSKTKQRSKMSPRNATSNDSGTVRTDKNNSPSPGAVTGAPAVTVPSVCETGPATVTAGVSTGWPLLPGQNNELAGDSHSLLTTVATTATHDLFNLKPDLINSTTSNSNGTVSGNTITTNSFHTHSSSLSSGSEDDSPNDRLSCDSPAQSHNSSPATGTGALSIGNTNMVPSSHQHLPGLAYTNSAPAHTKEVNSFTQQLAGLSISGGSYIDNLSDSMSLFSGNGFNAAKAAAAAAARKSQQNKLTEEVTEIPDVIPVTSTTDWSAAFGFNATKDAHEDELGFDPWDESTKALADMIEMESVGQTSNLFPAGLHSPFPSQHFTNVPSTAAHSSQIHHPPLPPPGLQHHMPCGSNTQTHPPKCLPPGFGPSQIQHTPPQYNGHINGTPPGLTSSKMLNLMHSTTPNSTTQNPYPSEPLDPHHPPPSDWQDGLRALLPNINISFGTAPPNTHLLQDSQHPQQKGWPDSSPLHNTEKDLPTDPAIVTQASIREGLGHSDEPHWMASLHNLTDEGSTHRLPFAQQFSCNNGNGWVTNSMTQPPPGFQTQILPNTQLSESTLTEGLQ